MYGPERCFFWVAATQSWRPALTDEPGDLVWNPSTHSWGPGAIGGNWKWNATNQSWEPGPGGTHVWNATTQCWDPITEAGYGGSHYFSAGVWVPNVGSPGAGANDLLLETGWKLLTEAGDAILMES